MNDDDDTWSSPELPYRAWSVRPMTFDPAKLTFIPSSCEVYSVARDELSLHHRIFGSSAGFGPCWRSRSISRSSLKWTAGRRFSFRLPHAMHLHEVTPQ